jgi:uncharacterized protein YcaQ
MIEVSLEKARAFILDSLGLRTGRPFRSVVDVVRRIHNIQIDTISVVSRSHNLILYNRWPEYREGAVWKAQREKEVLEWWSHGMCIIPVETYPFITWRQRFYDDSSWGSLRKWGSQNRALIEEVYNHVKREGPTRSASLGERREKSDGWWDWKAEKMALEHLFLHGRLLVAYRDGFQKHYDLTERVLPAGIDSEPMSDDEAAEFLATTTIGSLGLASQKDLRTYLGRLPPRKLWSGRTRAIEGYLESLEQEGIVQEVSIEGVQDRYFALAGQTSRLQTSTVKHDDDVPVKMLTPFDNLVRERHYPSSLWDFDYMLECYTPADKRKHGYFALPLLDRDMLVGRVDAKMHRAENRLELKALYLEHDFWKEVDGLERLAKGIASFAEFHGAASVTVGRTNPASAKKRVQGALV